MFRRKKRFAAAVGIKNKTSKNTSEKKESGLNDGLNDISSSITWRFGLCLALYGKNWLIRQA
jgi:hypothetical protein